jgi:hypothetical protein
MKQKVLLLAVFLIAAIYLMYKRTISKKESVLITGSWKLDSVKTGADSNLIYFMLLSSMKKDSSEVDFRFTNDTLITYASGEADTTGFHFNARKQELTLENDEKEVFECDKINDSIISLTAKDSTSLYLKKVKD